MQRRIAGLRIRERRRELGLKQNELAARVGVSAAYLNLIERNKRGIGGALLARIGRELHLTLDQLDGMAERRLREELNEVAAEPELAEAASGGPPDEFIARFPGWARAAALLHRRWRAAAAEAEAMADRLAHDPALGAAIHAMLTEITALRSTAEILTEGREVSAPQRRRFEQIIYEQSSRLAATGAELAAYFDGAAESRRRPAPVGAAEEALERAPGIGDAIERLAAAARVKLSGGDIEARLEKLTPRPPEIAPDAGRAERLGALARAHAAQAHRRALFDLAEPFAPAGEPDADEVLALVEAEMAQRLADAILAPPDGFLALGARLGWEVGALTRALDGDSGLVMRRIACLGVRSGRGAPRAAHVAVDASGRVLARRGAADLLPRSRRLDCPVWPAHRAGFGAGIGAGAGTGGALALPLRHPDGARIFAVAAARAGGMATDMLVFDAEAARQTAYAGALAGTAEGVGPDCRICAHRDCPSRREAAVIQT